jgi:DNA-binding GntR family transcriptional regulator
VGRARDGEAVRRAYGLLRRAIIDGELLPGARLSQEELVRDMGIGRTPLRGALRMLMAERLVLGEPNRQVRVAPLSAEEARETALLLATLETTAARSGDVEQWVGAARALPRSWSAAELEALDDAGRARRWDVHRLWVEAAGPRHAVVVGRLFDVHERYRRAARTPVDPAAYAVLVDRAASGDRRGVVDVLTALHAPPLTPRSPRAADAPPRPRRSRPAA